MKDYIDWEIIYYEFGKLLLQQFRYEVDGNRDEIIKHMPDDLYKFKKYLQNRKIPFVICVGELSRDTGVNSYCRAEPIS